MHHSSKISSDGIKEQFCSDLGRVSFKQLHCMVEIGTIFFQRIVDFSLVVIVVLIAFILANMVTHRSIVF